MWQQPLSALGNRRRRPRNRRREECDTRTWLQNAAMNGKADIVRLLIEIRAHINESPVAFQLAAGNGHTEVVQQLLEWMGSEGTTAPQQTMREALNKAASRGHARTVKLLLDRSADVNASDNLGRIALPDAASSGHTEIVKLLLDYGAKINAEGRNGTALREAASRGYKEIVELLLNRGANINATTVMGTALYAAASSGYKEIVELLLNREADVNAFNINRERVTETALHGAASGGHKETVELLLGRGANINAKGEGLDDHTALYLAVRQLREDVVEVLLRNGAEKDKDLGELVYTSSRRDADYIFKDLLPAIS